MKAFSAHAMLRLAADEGLDLLAASGGEVDACMRAGIAPARIALHGRNKSDDELEQAIEARVGLLIADGLDEIRRVDAFARTAGIVQPFLIRVNPGVRVDTHESIATGHESTAFGLPRPNAAATIAAPPRSQLPVPRAPGARRLQCPPRNRSCASWTCWSRWRGGCAKHRGIAVEMIDIGGGFAITYTNKRTPSIAESRRPNDVSGCRAASGFSRCRRSRPSPEEHRRQPRISLYRVGDRRTLGEAGP